MLNTIVPTSKALAINPREASLFITRQGAVSAALEAQRAHRMGRFRVETVRTRNTDRTADLGFRVALLFRSGETAGYVVA